MATLKFVINAACNSHTAFVAVFFCFTIWRIVKLNFLSSFICGLAQGGKMESKQINKFKLYGASSAMSLCLVKRWFSTLIALFMAFSITIIKILGLSAICSRRSRECRDKDLFIPCSGVWWAMKTITRSAII